MTHRIRPGFLAARKQAGILGHAVTLKKPALGPNTLTRQDRLERAVLAGG